MAWYDIKGTCGHTFRKQLYGKIKGREDYVDWAENNLMCPDCFKQQKELEKKAETEKAKKETKGLPDLEGSEKQKNWAYVLRKKRIDLILSFIGDAIERNQSKEWIEFLEKKLESTKKEISSKFFINRRDNNIYQFKEAFSNLKKKKIAQEYVEQKELKKKLITENSYERFSVIEMD